MRKKQKISFARGPWGERGAERCKKKQSSSDGTRKAYKGLLLNLIKA
jgi:hypothetical protein